MKKYAKILVAVTFLLGFSVAANAEIRGEVVVKLPFAFVASGVTLPDGSCADPSWKCFRRSVPGFPVLTQTLI